jgi:hypothetical protein
LNRKNPRLLRYSISILKRGSETIAAAGGHEIDRREAIDHRVHRIN